MEILQEEVMIKKEVRSKAKHFIVWENLLSEVTEKRKNKCMEIFQRFFFRKIHLKFKRFFSLSLFCHIFTVSWLQNQIMKFKIRKNSFASNFSSPMNFWCFFISKFFLIFIGKIKKKLILTHWVSHLIFL